MRPSTPASRRLPVPRSERVSGTDLCQCSTGQRRRRDDELVAQLRHRARGLPGNDDWRAARGRRQRRHGRTDRCPSKPHVTLNAGQTYYIQVAATRAPMGESPRVASASSSPRPPRPTASGAVQIGAVPFSQTSTTAEATGEGGEALTACAPIGKTVWYRFTPAANMTVTASTQGSTSTPSSSPGEEPPSARSTQVGCDDDGIATGEASRITGLALVAGQTYDSQVGGYR